MLAATVLKIGLAFNLALILIQLLAVTCALVDFLVVGSNINGSQLSYSDREILLLLFVDIRLYLL